MPIWNGSRNVYGSREASLRHACSHRRHGRSRQVIGRLKASDPLPQAALHSFLNHTPVCYSGVIFEACLPFAPCVTSKLTFWFSCSDLNPLP